MFQATLYSPESPAPLRHDRASVASLHAAVEDVRAGAKGWGMAYAVCKSRLRVRSAS